MTIKSATMVAAAVSVICGGDAFAQSLAKANVVTATATIQAIDSTTRTITLKNEQGEEDRFVAGPNLQRFAELKVGDKVRMTYYESLVFDLRKPGETSSGTVYDAAAARAKTGLPAGMVATQQKTTVTVKAVDLTVPSITVTTEDGRVVTRKIEDKSNLTNVKAGDRIDITYTQALLTNIEPVK